MNSPLTTVRWLLGLLFFGGFVTGAPGVATSEWLAYYGLQSWEVVLDPDLDGFTTEEEYSFGTNPLDKQSRPPVWVVTSGWFELRRATVPGVRYRVEASTDLVAWSPVAGLPSPLPDPLVLTSVPGDRQRFFRFGVEPHPDTDGDCLPDFEEFTIWGTDPLKADTDGDGLSDCEEVNLFHSNPNHASLSGRGMIQGKVVLDDDKDPATRTGNGLAGWTVLLDLDRNGVLDPFEPQVESDAKGEFQFREIDPGNYRVSLSRKPAWAQVFPAASPPTTADGYVDRATYKPSPLSGLPPQPYGRTASRIPARGSIVADAGPVPVEASIIVGAPPPPPYSAPAGVFAQVSWLSLPQDSELTVAFDGEELFDGPGADLVIIGEGQSQEEIELYAGSSEADLTLVGRVKGTDSTLVDFAGVSLPEPIRYLKLKGLDLVGRYPGFDLVGLEALHYRPRDVSSYDVTVVGGQTVAGIDFGVTGADHPPKVFITPERGELRAGETVGVLVVASDDIGITSVNLTMNGLPVALDTQGKGAAPIKTGGVVEFSANAVDTAGQSNQVNLLLVARNADGSLPDLSGLSLAGGNFSGPAIRVFSPATGEIVSNTVPIVASITATGLPVTAWKLYYAPANEVDPRALDVADPDYVLLSQGTGPITSGVLGEFPGGTLAPGAYLVRISATDQAGITAYLGFVVGVRIDPLEIRPNVVLSAPTNESTITYVTNIIGSVSSRQPFREWYVEYAPLSQVDLQNLSDNHASWVRIGTGTTLLTNAVLASFDPTVLPNDSYVIRVSAWNQNGLGWTTPLVLHVVGHAKLGNFAVEYVDVNVPLAGIPIRIKRSYNSLNAAKKGDFGYGWSLAVQDADIRETVPQTGSGFASTPFKVGTRVYLNAPDGQRIGFTFKPQVVGYSIFGAVSKAVFVPDPGITYTLQVPERDSPFLNVSSTGEARLLFVSMNWNPDTYILTDKDGQSYTYDQTAGLMEIQDPNGNRVTFTRNAITHSSGPYVALERDADGRVIRITAPGGRIWTYEYSGVGDLSHVQYPEAIRASFLYSGSHPHYLETIDDPVRQPIQKIEYDSTGRVVARIDAAGVRREQSWDPAAFSGSYSDGRGNVTKFFYDARGNIIRRINPMGGTNTFVFGDRLNPDLETLVTDERGNSTSYVYDRVGNVLSVTQPLKRTTTYTYDSANHVIRTLHATSASSMFAYDTAGNMTNGMVKGATYSFRYTASGRVSTSQDGEGGVTKYDYEGSFPFPTRITTPSGGMVAIDYDAAARITSYVDPTGASNRFEYDRQERLVKHIDPAGGITLLTYDPVHPSLPATFTDRLGRVTQYTYDSLGRLTVLEQPNGATTRYEYDVDGNRTALVDPAGNRYEFRYDAMNYLVQEIDPRGNSRFYTHDAAGNLIEATDRNGRRRSFVYDAANRLVQENWHDPSDQSILRTITIGYDRLDRIINAKDPEAAVALSYLPLPEQGVVQESVTYPGVPERLMGTKYDNAGRRSYWNILGHLEQFFTRDLEGRLVVATFDHGAGARARVEYGLNLRQDVTGLRRFNELHNSTPLASTSFDIDPRGWLTRIEHFDSSTQTISGTSVVLTRGVAGEILSREEGTNSFLYGYDETLQLTQVTRNGVLTEHYAYGTNGNRLSSHRHSTYQTAAANRLTEAFPWRLTYDREGNLVEKSNSASGLFFRYEWDHRNRLMTVSRMDGLTGNSVVTDYRYDPLNRRIAATRAGQTTWTYYDGWTAVAEFVGTNSAASQLFFPSQRLDKPNAVWRKGEGIFWFLLDQIGSVRHVISSNATLLATYDYDAFGNSASAEGTNLDFAGRTGFSGRELDSETGLYYHRARYYDPDAGRFVSEDPIAFRGKDPNLYRYVHNSPLNGTDPSGLTENEEEGLLNVVVRKAEEAICEAGANTAIVLLEATAPTTDPYISGVAKTGAATACRAAAKAARAEVPPPTPEEINLNKQLEIPWNPEDIDPQDAALDNLVKGWVWPDIPVTKNGF